MEYQSLWHRYKKKNDFDAKCQLIEKYIEIVKVIAGRLYTAYGSNVEYDDLISYGVFGLIDAIEKFDIDKNVKFETYAQIRIRGAIIDQLRNFDWIPRSIRQKAKAVEEAYMKLESTLNRSASDSEMAEELGVSVEEYQHIIQQINQLNVVSFEEKIIDGYLGHWSQGEQEYPENIVCNKEIYEMLKNNIEKLPEREKQVISLYYYDELTYKEIGEILGVSESRVSQLHSKAILRLKTKLEPLVI